MLIDQHGRCSHANELTPGPPSQPLDFICALHHIRLVVLEVLFCSTEVVNG